MIDKAGAVSTLMTRLKKYPQGMNWTCKRTSVTALSLYYA